MYCPDCGKENPAGQRFCRSCGLSLKPVSQALAGKLPANDEESTVLLRDEPRFWNNPFIYGVALMLLGMIIGVVGDKVFSTRMVIDVGTILALLGIGLIGLKGVLLVASPRYSPRSKPVPRVEEISKLAPELLSAEPPSITETTTRQLDSRVEIRGEGPRDTQPTSERQ